MKIIVGINALTSIDQLAYTNHIQFFYRVGRNFPDIEFGLSCPRRMSIDRMRNITAKVALEHNFDYLMFIDDDVLVPFDALKKLLDCKADIAAGWTIIRGYPYNNMFFKYTDDNTLTYYNEGFQAGDIVECDAVGFSCALIKTELLKRVPPPYFVTGTHNTEDIYFCVKAKEYYPECKIVVDTSICTAHILGTEVISPLNVAKYREYVEDSSMDRGDNYLNMIKSI